MPPPPRQARDSRPRTRAGLLPKSSFCLVLGTDFLTEEGDREYSERLADRLTSFLSLSLLYWLLTNCPSSSNRVQEESGPLAICFSVPGSEIPES